MPSMNEKSFLGGTIGTAISGGAIALSTTELSQWISIACTILGLIITIITAIIIPLCQKESITADDLNKVKDELDKVKDEMEDINKNG